MVIGYGRVAYVRFGHVIFEISNKGKYNYVLVLSDKTANIFNDLYTAKRSI